MIPKNRVPPNRNQTTDSPVGKPHYGFPTGFFMRRYNPAMDEYTRRRVPWIWMLTNSKTSTVKSFPPMVGRLGSRPGFETALFVWAIRTIGCRVP